MASVPPAPSISRSVGTPARRFWRRQLVRGDLPRQASRTWGKAASHEMRCGQECWGGRRLAALAVAVASGTAGGATGGRGGNLIAVA